MDNIRNLYSVKATVLPARVLMLLSKYAKVLMETDGTVIELSSLDVFKHVHNSYVRSHHPKVGNYYRYLLSEVNRELSEGNMAISTQFEAVSTRAEAVETQTRATSYNSKRTQPLF